jgi:hypothetical protein
VRTPAIVSSGWWVAAAAAALSVIVVLALLVPLRTKTPGNAAGRNFDLGQLSVEPDSVVRAMARDGVHVLTEPAMMTVADIELRDAEERGKLLVSDDRVIGITIGPEARAYPLSLMRWHEVVNDVVGGELIAVTYSPLCDSVAVFDRWIDGVEVELGASGLLYNSIPLLYDRRRMPAESPLWIQLDGRPLTTSAPSLPVKVTELATWAEWRERHPDTLVLAPLPELARLYKRDPYHSYFGSDVLRFPVDPLPPAGELHLKDRVVVVTVDGRDSAFVLSRLATAVGSDGGEYVTEASELPIRIRFKLHPGTASVEPLATDRRLDGVRHTFWFAWYALGGMIPDTVEFPQSDLRE